MPKYTAEILGSGEVHTFSSVPELLKFINKNRGKKLKRNVGAKSLKKILQGNGVFENVLRIKKIMKKDMVSTSSNAEMMVDSAPQSRAPTEGGEQPEKPLPFKTRRSKRVKDREIKDDVLKAEDTVKVVEKGNDQEKVRQGEIIEIDTETPQVKKKQPASQKKKRILAKGRVTQKINALYRSLISEKPVSAPSLFQAYEALKKSMDGLGTASIMLSTLSVAKKNNLDDYSTLLDTLEMSIQNTEKALDQNLGLTFASIKSENQNQDALREQERKELEEDTPTNKTVRNMTPDGQIFSPGTPVSDQQRDLTLSQLETTQTGNEGNRSASVSANLTSEMQEEDNNNETISVSQMKKVDEQMKGLQDEELESLRSEAKKQLETARQLAYELSEQAQVDEERKQMNKDFEEFDAKYKKSSVITEKDVLQRYIKQAKDFQAKLTPKSSFEEKEVPLKRGPAKKQEQPVTRQRFAANVNTDRLLEKQIRDAQKTVEDAIAGLEGKGAMQVGGATEEEQTTAIQQELRRREEERPSAEPAMPLSDIPLNPEAPDLSELYPLTRTNLQNLGQNSVINYHDLRIMLNTVQDVPTFLKTLREFGMKSFYNPNISNAIQGQLLEVAQSYRGEPAMYAKYIVHFLYFVLKHKLQLKASELSKIEAGISQKFQQFFGTVGEVEDNSITSHIRYMVNEAAGITLDAEPMVQGELLRGAGALDSIEKGLKEVVRTTDNQLMEREVVARRRMHKTHRRGMVMYEPGKSNLSTQARLSAFKTPIDPELRRPLSQHMAPTQRVTSTPRVSVVRPNAPQRVSIPQKVPTLVGDERPEAFSTQGAKKDLDRSDLAINLNTRNILNSNLGQTLLFTGRGAVDQSNLRRRRGITLYNNDSHERRAHKRLRASFTLNMWNEV